MYQVWLEWQRTGRYWDSDQPPESWDTEIRENVESYDYYWKYLKAYMKQGG